MRNVSTTQLSIILLSACLVGVTQEAEAQDTNQGPTVQGPTVQGPTVQDEPQTTLDAQVEGSSSTVGLAPASAVPAYQPREYELTAPGSTGTRSEVRRWPNRPLLITSTLMFAGAYVPAALFGKFEDDTTDNLYIPVAGPWLELAREPASGGSKAMLVISGVFQDLGALGMVTSLFVPERRTSRWFLIGNERLSAAPVADRYTYGVSARGRF